jgi:hypothetical protein
MISMNSENARKKKVVNIEECFIGALSNSIQILLIFSKHRGRLTKRCAA